MISPALIIDSLKMAIAKGEQVKLRPPTENLEAYDYYLRGYYLFRKGSGTDRNLIDSSIVAFEKATSLDRGFALAYAALGKAYAAIFFIYDPDPKWETKAFVNIEKAISLDQNSLTRMLQKEISYGPYQMAFQRKRQ